MSAPAGEIVDAHVHLWEPRRLDYAWLAGTDLERRFDVDDLIAAARPVGRFVVVQADCAPAQAEDEVRWIVDQSEHRGVLAGIVAFAAVERGRDVEAAVRRLRACPAVVGVRRLLQDEPLGFALRQGFLNGLSILGTLGLPFDLCVRDHQLPEVIDVVHRTPETVFVLDHLGKPRVGGDDDAWRRDITRLARASNVVCKLSGLGSETGGRPATFALVRPYLQHALDEFGPSRCMFGSDWPVLTRSMVYRDWVDAISRLLDGYGDAARDDVLGGTAGLVYAPSDQPITIHEEAS